MLEDKAQNIVMGGFRAHRYVFVCLLLLAFAPSSVAGEGDADERPIVVHADELQDAIATLASQPTDPQLRFQAKSGREYVLGRFPENVDRAEFDKLPPEGREKFLKTREMLLRGLAGLLDPSAPFIGSGALGAEVLARNPDLEPGEKRRLTEISLSVVKNLTRIFDVPANADLSATTRKRLRADSETTGQQLVQTLIKAIDSKLWENAAGISSSPEISKLSEWATNAQAGAFGGWKIGKGTDVEPGRFWLWKVLPGSFWLWKHLRKGYIPYVNLGLSISFSRKRREVVFEPYLDVQGVDSVMPGYAGVALMGTVYVGKRETRWEDPLKIRESMVISMMSGVLFITPDEFLIGGVSEFGFGLPWGSLFDGWARRIPLFRAGFSTRPPYVRGNTILGPKIKQWCQKIYSWLVGGRRRPRA